MPSPASATARCACAPGSSRSRCKGGRGMRGDKVHGTLPPPRPPARRMPLILRLALRELRGGLSGFGVFLACIALGVAPSRASPRYRAPSRTGSGAKGAGSSAATCPTASSTARRRSRRGRSSARRGGSTSSPPCGPWRWRRWRRDAGGTEGRRSRNLSGGGRTRHGSAR